MTLEQQIISRVKSRLTRGNLEEIEEKVLQKADLLKNQNTQIGKAPSDRSIYIRPLSKQYAKRTGKRYANMRGKTNNIEKTTIVKGGDSSSLRFTDSESAVIFNYHDKGTAKGGKKREIYPKQAQFIDPELRKVMINELKVLLNG